MPKQKNLQLWLCPNKTHLTRLVREYFTGWSGGMGRPTSKTLVLWALLPQLHPKLTKKIIFIDIDDGDNVVLRRPRPSDTWPSVKAYCELNFECFVEFRA